GRVRLEEPVSTPARPQWRLGRPTVIERLERVELGGLEGEEIALLNPAAHVERASAARSPWYLLETDRLLQLEIFNGAVVPVLTPQITRKVLGPRPCLGRANHLADRPDG